MKIMLSIFMLMFLLTSCTSPDNAAVSESPANSSTKSMPPIVTASATPKTSSVVPSIPFSVRSPGNALSPTPSQPVVTAPETTPRSLEDEMLSVFPGVKRISGLISLGYDEYQYADNYSLIPAGNNKIAADFNCDGTDDVLQYSAELYKSSEIHSNHPITVTLTIGGSSVVINDDWNDGIFLFTADFDEQDGFIDIGLISTGTDIECILSIYRYDGASINKYLSLSYFHTGYIYYNGIGEIYYFSTGYIDLGNGDFDIDYDRSDKPECYDYRLKTIIPAVQ